MGGCSQHNRHFKSGLCLAALRGCPDAEHLRATWRPVEFLRARKIPRNSSKLQGKVQNKTAAFNRLSNPLDTLFASVFSAAS